MSGLVWSGANAPAASATPTAAPATLAHGASPYPVFMNGDWQNTLPTDPYYLDPWHVAHTGVDMGNGSTWFPSITNERTGTADLHYGWMTDPNQAQMGVSAPGTQGGNVDLGWIGNNVTDNVTHNGQSGFTVKNSEVANIGNYMAQTSRDNGKYAVKSSGFGGFGMLLGIAAMAFGQPELAGLMGGSFGAEVAAGAIIGAGTSAIQGGDPLKGAVAGGIGGAFGASDFGDAASGTIADAVGAGAGTLARTAVNAGVQGAVSGAAGALVNGGSFADIARGTAIGAVGGAAGGAAGGLAFDATHSNFAASVAKGAVGGGTGAVLNGRPVGYGVATGTAGGAASGAVTAAGGNSTLANGAGMLARTVVGDSLNSTPSAPGPITPTTAATPTTVATAVPSFASSVFEHPAIKPIDWSAPLRPGFA